MRTVLERLRQVTDTCRDDMHEPDEQELSAKVYGDHLDNAMGDSLYVPGSQGDQLPWVEYVVCLTREKSDGTIETEWFNLATLIALARKAQL